MPQSFKKNFGGPQPWRSAPRGRLLEIDDEFAHRVPNRLRVSVLDGKWDRCALVGGEQGHAKTTGLPIWDQDTGQAAFFRVGWESAIHAVDDAKILNACVAFLCGIAGCAVCAGCEGCEGCAIWVPCAVLSGILRS